MLSRALTGLVAALQECHLHSQVNAATTASGLAAPQNLDSMAARRLQIALRLSLLGLLLAAAFANTDSVEDKGSKEAFNGKDFVKNFDLQKNQLPKVDGLDGRKELDKILFDKVPSIDGKDNFQKDFQKNVGDLKFDKVASIDGKDNFQKDFQKNVGDLKFDKVPSIGVKDDKFQKNLGDLKANVDDALSFDKFQKQLDGIVKPDKFKGEDSWPSSPDWQSQKWEKEAPPADINELLKKLSQKQPDVFKLEQPNLPSELSKGPNWKPANEKKEGEVDKSQVGIKELLDELMKPPGVDKFDSFKPLPGIELPSINDDKFLKEPGFDKHFKVRPPCERWSAV
jgi:hypothetical protein